MLLRVMIFDNNDDALDTVNYSLSCRGHEVYCLDEPAMCPVYTDSACNCPQKYPCGDILLIRNDMSLMTGLEFIRQQCLRGCKGSAANKAIMTGALSSEEKVTAEQLGCKVFTDPLHLQDLFAWVEERRKIISPARTLAPVIF